MKENEFLRIFGNALAFKLLIHTSTKSFPPSY